MTERRWDNAAVETEAAAFVDYWHAKPGKDGRKADWAATWRNWVRNSRRAGDEPQSPMVRALLDREARREAYQPKTADELERAIAAGENYGWDVTELRQRLAAMREGQAPPMNCFLVDGAFEPTAEQPSEKRSRRPRHVGAIASRIVDQMAPGL